MSDYPTSAQYLDAVDESARFVSLLTGVKQQFVDAGWDERMAEQATLMMLQASASNPSRDPFGGTPQ